MDQKQSRPQISGKFSIPSPCSQDWNEMPGSTLVRNCSACQHEVYNFAAMSDAEIARVISAQEGRICARMYLPTHGEIVAAPQRPTTLRITLRGASRWTSAALTAALGAASLGAAPSTPVPVTRPKTEIDHAALIQIQSAAPQGFAIEVVDITGAIIAGAAVTAINEVTRAKVEGLTDQSGQLKLPDLPAGQYRITVEKNPFRMLTLEHVKVPASEVLHTRMDLPAIMGEVVLVRTFGPKRIFGPETQPTQVSGSLTEPPQASPAKPNVFHRFFSAIRNAF